MAQLQTAIRVVKTIEYLARHGRARLDEIAAELGVHKSSALRLLTTLRELDWIAVDDRRHYAMSPHLVAVGQAAAAGTSFQQALELAEELRDLSGESVHVAVPHGHRMLIVARVDSHDPLRVSCELGSRDALHTSSLGKAYLASLSDVELEALIPELELIASTPFSMTSADALQREVADTRERGYSLDFEEGRLGVCCMGFGLRLGSHHQLASLSITGPAHRWTREAMESLARDLLKLVEVVKPAVLSSLG